MVVLRPLPSHVPTAYLGSLDAGDHIGRQAIEEIGSACQVLVARRWSKEVAIVGTVQAAKKVEAQPRGREPSDLSPAAAAADWNHSRPAGPRRQDDEAWNAIRSTVLGEIFAGEHETSEL